MILFVTPPIRNMNAPEIGLLSIASYIERETTFPFRVVDMNTEKLHRNQMLLKDSPRMLYQELEEVIINDRPRIVAVGGATYYVNNSLKVLEIAKKIDSTIKTVIGGPHASAVMGELMEKNPYVDILVYGEGEDTFLEIAKNILGPPETDYAIDGTIVRRDGRICINTPRKLRTNIDYFPFPNRDLVPIHHYPTPFRIISSRGCPFNCVFCLRSVFGSHWRGRSATNVVDEIESLYKKYGWKRFIFSDDNFTINKARVKNIASEILKRNLRIEWNTGTAVRADCVDYDILKLMKESGCTRIGIGIESGCPNILRNINKKETLNDILGLIRTADSVGLDVHGSFMIGNPGDNMSTIETSIEFAKRCIDNGMKSISWNIATPYPGTMLWEYAIKKGRLLKIDYDDYVHNADEPIFETDDFDIASRRRAMKLAKEKTRRYLRIVKIKSLLKNPRKIIPFIKRKIKQ